MRLRRRKQPKERIYNSGGYGNRRDDPNNNTLKNTSVNFVEPPHPEEEEAREVEVLRFLQHMISIRGCANPCFVAQKNLTDGDVKNQLGCLSMLPVKNLVNTDNFLSEEERNFKD